MTNKHIERYVTSSAIKITSVQIETTLNTTIHLLDWLKFKKKKKLIIQRVSEDTEQMNTYTLE